MKSKRIVCVVIDFLRLTEKRKHQSLFSFELCNSKKPFRGVFPGKAVRCWCHSCAHRFVGEWNVFSFSLMPCSENNRTRRRRRLRALRFALNERSFLRMIGGFSQDCERKKRNPEVFLSDDWQTIFNYRNQRTSPSVNKSSEKGEKNGRKGASRCLRVVASPALSPKKIDRSHFLVYWISLDLLLTGDDNYLEGEVRVWVWTNAPTHPHLQSNPKMLQYCLLESPTTVFLLTPSWC